MLSDGMLQVQKNNNPCGPGCKCVGCCDMPKGVSPGQANVEQEDNVDSCEPEDDLIEVDDVINDVFGISTKSDSDGDDNEKEEDDTSTFEANSDTDINTSDDGMEIDITW